MKGQLKLALTVGLCVTAFDLAQAEPSTELPQLQDLGTCAAQWHPTHLPKGTEAVYRLEDSKAWYRVVLLEETDTDAGRLRVMDASMYADMDGDGTAEHVGDKREVQREFVFLTETFTPRHTHFRVFHHEKPMTRMSSRNFQDIRKMAAGETYIIKARQSANQSRKLIATKWTRADIDIKVSLLGCGEDELAGKKFKTRVFRVEYAPLKPFVDGRPKTLSVDDIEVLDEETGLSLRGYSFDTSGKIQSSSYLAGIGQIKNRD